MSLSDALVVRSNGVVVISDQGQFNIGGTLYDLGTAASHPASDFTSGGTALLKASNLSDLASASTARTNLGLGTAATSASTAFDAAGAAATVQSASLQKSSNLSDLASASTARTNLGLGSAATSASTAFDAAGAAAAVGLPATTAVQGVGTGNSPQFVSVVATSTITSNTNFTAGVGGSSGSGDVNLIYLNNSTATNPTVKWNATDSNLGLRVYSNTFEVARFQDNGYLTCPHFATMGGCIIGDFFIQRGVAQGIKFIETGEIMFGTGAGLTTEWARIKSTGLQLSAIPTSDPADGTNTLWMDAVTRTVKVGT